MRNKLAVAAIGAALLMAPRLAAAQTAAPDAQIFAGGLVGVTFGTETGAMFGGRVAFRVARNIHLFARSRADHRRDAEGNQRPDR